MTNGHSNGHHHSSSSKHKERRKETEEERRIRKEKERKERDERHKNETEEERKIRKEKERKEREERYKKEGKRPETEEERKIRKEKERKDREDRHKKEGKRPETEEERKIRKDKERKEREERYKKEGKRLETEDERRIRKEKERKERDNKDHKKRPETEEERRERKERERRERKEREKVKEEVKEEPMEESSAHEEESANDSAMDTDNIKEEPQEDEEDEEEMPIKKSRKRKSYKEESDEDFKAEESEEEKPKKKKKKIKHESEDDYASEEEVKPKKKSAKEAKKAKEKAKPASKSKVKQEPVSPTKGGKKKKEDDTSQVWKWWEEDEHKKDDGTKWYFLEHQGPLFAPLYDPLPDGVRFYYDGKVMRLSEPTEEVATFYGKMLDHDYTTKEVFNKNFFKDWRRVMTEKEKEKIRDLSKCDFQEINEYFKKVSEERKNRSKEEKKAEKAKNDELSEHYGFCEIDGHKEKIGNFRIEPPGLFRGRGEHPKQGMLKRRVMPEDVIINCSKDSTFPKPPDGHKWKEVRHDNTVTWLASWTENIQNSIKYVMLNPSSKLKGEKDMQKYEKARLLKGKIDKIRADYVTDFKSKEMRIRQRAVALYFIDKLALRAGNEKDEDQADTVGCCSLRVEHINLHPEKDGKVISIFFRFWLWEKKNWVKWENAKSQTSSRKKIRENERGQTLTRSVFPDFFINSKH